MLNISEDTIKEMFVVLQLPKTEIARRLKTSVRTINLRLEKMKLTRATLPSKRRSKNFIGKRFGQLVIIAYAGADRFKKTRVLCQCDCGNEKSINISSLKRGLTKSCGCRNTSIVRKKGYKDISFQYFRKLKYCAFKRGIEFNITLEYIWEIYEKQCNKCCLTGLPLFFSPDYNCPEKQSASIDRIDSTKGYIVDNIQIVHKLVNISKGWLPDKDFIYLCYMVAETREKPNEDSINFNLWSVRNKARFNDPTTT